MQELNSNNLDVLRKEINEALKPITSKHNVAFTIGKMSYDSESMDFKVTCSVIPKGIDPEYVEGYRSLERYGHAYALDEDDFMQEIVLPANKGVLKIIGINPRSRKFPIQALKEGKRYNYGESILKHYKKKETA